MSGKIMGEVYDLELPHHEQSILLALADHADHQGENVFPSYGLIAWKTGYSVRQVQRIIKKLIADGLLERMGVSDRDTIIFKINLSVGKVKTKYTGRACLPVHPRVKMSHGDTQVAHPPVTSGCPTPSDIWVSHKPSVEPSLEPLGTNAPKFQSTATPLQEISEATIAGTMQGDAVMPKKDVLEDTFDRAMRAKMRPNETTIRAWNLPPYLETVCIWFAEDAGVVVTKGDKGRWAKDAQQISELHPTREHMRKATERAKSWRTKDGTSFTIASPHAIYDTIKQVMAEQVIPIRAEQQYETVMLPDGSMGRKAVNDA